MTFEEDPFRLRRPGSRMASLASGAMTGDSGIGGTKEAIFDSAR